MVAELVQDDEVLIVSRLTLMAARAGVEWREPWPVELPTPADCVPFGPPAHVVIFGRFELRFDPERMRSPVTAPTSAATCGRSKVVRSMPPRW